MEQNIPPIIAGKSETREEYAARHQEQAAADKLARLEALAASLKEDSEHVTSDEPIIEQKGCERFTGTYRLYD